MRVPVPNMSGIITKITIHIIRASNIGQWNNHFQTNQSNQWNNNFKPASVLKLLIRQLY